MRHELPITRVSPGQPVPSSRARPGLGVYKRRPRAEGFSFWRPRATAPTQARATAIVTRECAWRLLVSDARWWRFLDRWRGGGSTPNVGRASDDAPPGPSGGSTPNPRTKVARPNVRVATAPHETRGSSDVIEGARCVRRQSRVTSSDPA
jgi:hypothetical protein